MGDFLYGAGYAAAYVVAVVVGYAVIARVVTELFDWWRWR